MKGRIAPKGFGVDKRRKKGSESDVQWEVREQTWDRIFEISKVLHMLYL